MNFLLERIFDRKNFVVLIALVLFVILLVRLANITIVQGEYYREKADNSFLRSITLSAKRGEILDSNGVLLAGNVPSYTVQFLDATQYSEEINRVCIELLSLLDKQKENYLEFPIKIKNGEFYFAATIQTKEWLESNDFPSDSSADFVYKKVREQELIDESLNNFDAQELMLVKGIRLPISVRSMKFLYEIEKEQFLKYYGLDTDLTAEEVFSDLKNKRSFKITDEYSDEEALKIMTVRHAFNLQGYRGYVPIDIAKNISKETAIRIQELGMDFPGISITIEPIRDYPFGESAAHILGYMGRISSERETDKYNFENGYSPDDLIGKAGLENKYEDVLHGTDGNKYIYADAKGNYIGDFVEGIEGKESIASESGKSIQLTIDIELQKAVERYLKYGLEKIQEGGTYKSKWGNTTYKQYENAKTGAAVVVNVKTGEVLALANYPSYDLNLFSTGISQADWNLLQPENPRNPLDPRPLYNIATNTAVQPGSTFKLITVLSALEQGLDTYTKIYTDGVVEIGRQLFRCWYYRAPYYSKHGSINALQAIEVSCNYFMFDIVRGYDYYRNKPLNFEMNTDILLDYTQRLGLGKNTGIEIYEVNMGVPDEETKTNGQKYALRRSLNTHLKEYFDPEKLLDEDYLEFLISEILSWADEYVTLENGISRNEIVRRLMSLGSVKTLDETYVLADIIKYSYFEQIAWREGDDLNLSIGQGDHRYTVVQMARYIATIANDGIQNELTLIKEVDGKVPDREAGKAIDLVDVTHLADLREGMRLVAHGSRGSAKGVFQNFEFEVGAKTGTAQKAGRIPPLDEVEYLRENLMKITDKVNIGLSESNDRYLLITPQILEKATTELLVERNLEIANLKIKLNELEDGKERDDLVSKFEEKATGGYIEEGVVMRTVLKQLGNDRITDELIDSYRSEYDPFTWFVSFAPFDDPEICVVVLIPQGGSGGYAAPIVRDIYAKYFGLLEHDILQPW